MTTARPAERSDADAPKEIRQSLEGVELEFRLDGRARLTTQQQADRVNRKNKTNTDVQVKQLLGIQPADILGARDLLSVFTDANTDLIKNIANTQASQIGQIVRDNLIAGKTYEETSVEIQERTDVAKSRADFLARDQTAKLNSQLSAARMSAAGIDQYEWSGSMDERERDSHREKEGRIYSWDSPPSDTGHPGEDYNCRCVAIPVLDV